MDSLRRVYPDLVTVDGGNFGEAASGRSTWKTVELFKAMFRLKYDAIALGPRDLFPELADSVNALHARDVLFSGLEEAKGKLGLSPVRVIARTGAKLAVINVASPQFNTSAGSTPVPANEALKNHLGSLEGQGIDFRVVVYVGQPHELPALNRAFPEVDLWLQVNGNHRPIQLLDTVNDALMVSAGDRGREIGLITIEKEKNGSRISSSFNQIILDDRIKDSPKAQPFRDSFQKAQRAATAAPQPTAPPKGSGTGGTNGGLNPFIGSLACQKCHDQIYAKWQASQHAQAFAELKAKNENGNPACLGCHTTGFKEETGYARTAGTEHLAGVGCESCHGRGGFHVRMNGRISNFAQTNEAACRRCHDQQNSPSFVYAEYVARVH